MQRFLIVLTLLFIKNVSYSQFTSSFDVGNVVKPAVYQLTENGFQSMKNKYARLYSSIERESNKALENFKNE